MRLKVVLVVAALLPMACATSDQKSRDPSKIVSNQNLNSFHRSLSYSLIRTTQYTAALPHIKRMLESKESEAEGHYLMTRALMGLHRFRQAEKEIQRALALKPKFAPSHSLKGILLTSQGLHSEAEKAHREAIALDPKKPLYWNNLGFSLHLQQKYPKAIKAFENALELNPANTRRIHNNLAFTYAEAGDLPRAMEYFTRAGGIATANNNLGFVMEKQGKLEPAYNFYKKAWETDSTLVQARNNLQRLCTRLRRPMPAISQLSPPQDEPGSAPSPSLPGTQSSPGTKETQK